LAVTACGGDDDTAATDTEPTGSAPASSTSAPESTTTSVADPPTSVTSGPPPSASTTPGVPDADLPGEPVDFGPGAGVVVAVIGVEHDDVLNVRSLPGADQAIVGEAEPLADDLVATGRHRDIGESFWFEVTRAGVTGWVNASFVAYLGSVDDITSQIVAEVGMVGAETMLDLGELVAATRASDEPPSRITVTVAPTVGDLGEITLDVVGLGDDAITGERLHVFGTPEASGEGFSLRSVEAQLLCSRGVTTDDLCI
jgi:hypothetical protein